MLRPASHLLRFPKTCLLLLLMLPFLPQAAGAIYADTLYRVASSPAEHAVEEGCYDTFEEALAAAKASHLWYIMDGSGEIVYPARPNPADQVDLACLYLEAIAGDDRHGFALHEEFLPGKADGTGHYPPFYPFENGTDVYASLTGLGEYGNFNCSTAQIAAFTYSGYADLFGHGATGVGNFVQVALENGFSDVTASIDLGTGAGLKRGDILVYVADDCSDPDKPSHSHMATFLGHDTLLWCTGDLDKGRHGDTSGREISLHEYIDWSWQVVMRPVRTEEGLSRDRITVIDGIDWSAVYDYDYYVSANPDVREAYAGDYMLTLRHFVKYGIPEGRPGKAP